MATVIRQHIINMLEPLDMLCPDAHKWLEEECLPSDTFPIIYGRLLDQATTSYGLQKWLLQFYGKIGLEEAESLLGHYVDFGYLSPIRTPEEWRKNVFIFMPDAREVEEALRICYMSWQDDQQELEEDDE